MRSENIFSAGPSHLPTVVLNQLIEQISCYSGSNVSVLELGHRTPEFMQIIESAKYDLRKVLEIPNDFSIVFITGGASFQFEMVPLNIASSIGYVVSGRWSDLAYEEACRIKNNVKLCNKNPLYGDYSNFSLDECDFTDCEYIYYVSNETVHGIQISNQELDLITNKRNLICDMSSDILTREVKWDKHAIVFAGTAKNMGISGMSIVILHKSIVAHASSPAHISNYKELVNANSLYNTPATFQLFTVGLMLKWCMNSGGLQYFIQDSKNKSNLLYSELVKYPNILKIYPKKESYYSQINVVFHFINDSLTEKFIKFALEMDINSIKGYGDFGGIRFSLYNSITYDQVKLIVKCLSLFFEKENLL